MDILPITTLFKVFHPNSLKWPQIDGKPSLRLDLISQKNNFLTSGRAHEAMNDVEAVIELSKILSQQNKVWKYSLNFFNKTKDEVRIKNIDKVFTVQDKQFKLCLMVSKSFGSKVNYMALVLQLGKSLHYKNQSLWLRLDSEDILGLNADLDLSDTFVIRKRPGDALIVLPFLERFQDKMSKTSYQLAKENMAKIQNQWKRFFEYIQKHRF